MCKYSAIAYRIGDLLDISTAREAIQALIVEQFAIHTILRADRQRHLFQPTAAIKCVSGIVTLVSPLQL